MGVIAACNGYLETFGMTERVSNLAELAKLLGKLAEAGKIVALDEFQYFHRKQLGDFCSLLQAEAKFYRDAFEQGVLGADRADLLRRMFFSSSSPLRGEADNWFLRELRGRYDMILQHLARHPGCSNADIEAAIAQVSRLGEAKQVGGYLKILTERYRMIERRSPIFAKTKARSGRYYIRDNFLRAWLSALQRPVSMLR